MRGRVRVGQTELYSQKSQLREYLIRMSGDGLICIYSQALSVRCLNQNANCLPEVSIRSIPLRRGIIPMKHAVIFFMRHQIHQILVIWLVFGYSLWRSFNVLAADWPRPWPFPDPGSFRLPDRGFSVVAATLWRFGTLWLDQWCFCRRGFGLLVGQWSFV